MRHLGRERKSCTDLYQEREQQMSIYTNQQAYAEQMKRYIHLTHLIADLGVSIYLYIDRLSVESYREKLFFLS